MPPHAIIIGVPMFIIAIIRWQHSMNMSFEASSTSIISHFVPVDFMVQVILHIIIGIMPLDGHIHRHRRGGVGHCRPPLVLWGQFGKSASTIAMARPLNWPDTTEVRRRALGCGVAYKGFAKS